jgi:hypothetical protein
MRAAGKLRPTSVSQGDTDKGGRMLVDLTVAGGSPELLPLRSFTADTATSDDFETSPAARSRAVAANYQRRS